MSANNLTLTCATCGESETFGGNRRGDLVIALDASTWKTEPTSDGDSIIATCGPCLGSTMTHAQHAAAVFGVAE